LAKNSIVFKSNFSFQKLKNSFESILDGTLKNTGDKFADKSRKNIDEGVHPELRAITLRAREIGDTSFSGHNPSPSPNNDIPLKYTGRLYNSLEGTKDGVKGESYGLEHEKGFQGTINRVPARPFLAKSIDDSEIQKISSKMINQINKAMKK
tara:strand:- start:34 stop:489 length:456 start_codon:yes stop_codon:yes gene_type:complete